MSMTTESGFAGGLGVEVGAAGACEEDGWAVLGIMCLCGSRA